MAVKIFYSWQSDTSQKVNRYFIKEAIEKAIKEIERELELDESLSLDQDTKDVPGSPEIANTILRKIEECQIFLPDLTFVAKTTGGKNIPNPNVLIELGYAMKAVGPERLIGVMNEAYGAASAGLPFDLAHRRWPIRYYLDEEADSEVRRKEKDKLVSQLVVAIKAIVSRDTVINDNSQSKLNEVDKELFQLLLKELPLQGSGMTFLSKHDLGARFRSSQIEELDHFLSTWHDAEHEFQHEEMQIKLRDLYSLISAFMRKLNNKVFSTHGDWLSLELRDYETRPEMLKLRDELNQDATNVYEAYQDLVRAGRKLL